MTRFTIIFGALCCAAVFCSEELPKGDGKKPDPPAARSRAEVDAVLKASAPIPPPEKLKEINLLLLAGKKDHGPGEHDYPLWQKNWLPLMQKAAKVKVDTAFTWPTPEQMKAANILVCFYHSAWPDENLKEIDELLARGGGVVLIHWAVGYASPEPQKFADRFGFAYTSVYYRHGPLELKIAKPEHPIMKGLPERISLIDEAYWPLVGDPAKAEVLATSDELPARGAPVKMPFAQIWAKQHEKGRTFNMVPGHYNFSFNDPFFRLMLLRGMAWAGGEPETRFDGLATEGLELK